MPAFLRCLDVPTASKDAGANGNDVKSAAIEDDDASSAESDWDEPETEIVFIGQGMPAEQLITRLDACLTELK